MSKHTPGPWAMPDSGKGRISKVGANGGWDGLIATADCGDYARSKSEGLANARLIAAAPDLLEALRTAMQAFAEIRHAYMRPDWFTDGERAATQHLLMWQQRGTEAARAAIAKATGDTK